MQWLYRNSDEIMLHNRANRLLLLTYHVGDLSRRVSVIALRKIGRSPLDWNVTLDVILT